MEEGRRDEGRVGRGRGGVWGGMCEEGGIVCVCVCMSGLSVYEGWEGKVWGKTEN